MVGTWPFSFRAVLVFLRERTREDTGRRCVREENRLQGGLLQNEKESSRRADDGRTEKGK